MLSYISAVYCCDFSE